jgi:hypothetical protein
VSSSLSNLSDLPGLAGTGASQVESQLWKDIQAGNVHGGRWSASTTSRKPLMEIPTHLGPGDYDLTRWER